MRIDAHQHFWDYDPIEFGWINDEMAAIRRSFGPHDLRLLLDATGFEGCVAIQARSSAAENEYLLAIANTNPWVRGVVGWVDLSSPDCGAEMAHWCQFDRFRGVRHIVQAEAPGFLDSEEFRRGVRTLADFGLTYDVLIVPRQLEEANRFVRSLPNVQMVLDHMSKPDIRAGAGREWEDGFRRLAENSNLHCKISGLAFEADWSTWTGEQLAYYVEVAFDAFGAERCMLGSDWPVSLCAGSYAEIMEGLLPWDDCRWDQLGENAVRFYGL